VQALLREKLTPVEEVVRALPTRFRFFSTLALSAPRGFLRKLSLRDDYEDVHYYCALSVEPYAFLRNPHVKITCAYHSAVDRFIAEKMGKTVAHLPRQFIQFGETMKKEGIIDFAVATVAPPDADGYVNLGVNCETIFEAFNHFADGKRVKIFIEINSHMPWVNGIPETNGNRIHLSRVDAAWEHHERLTQLPNIVASKAEEKIAEHAARFVEDGDTVQLGIGGIPNVVAARLQERRDLKVHSELLTDSIVDLVQAGAVDSRGKACFDGLVVGAFATGTDKLYDWLHRNPQVALLPIRMTNDPCSIARNKRMKAINCALMVDLHGQVCSDGIGFKQVSGIGGQLEFVSGAQLSEVGRAIMCLKSTKRVGGKLRSNIVVTLPRGTPVTIPRQYADIIVTEHGAVDLRHADAVERAHLLVSIAHPELREELIQEATEAGLWQRRDGFDSFAKRALFNNVAYVRKLQTRLKQHPKQRGRILLEEVKRMLGTPDLPRKVVEFYQQNRR